MIGKMGIHETKNLHCKGNCHKTEKIAYEMVENLLPIVHLTRD
jgi:hypothetical protein